MKPEEKHIVAVAGNPNVGKSTVFNGLTGLKQHTGNWPGKTVSAAFGTLKTKSGAYTVADIPGTYSLSANSREEEIAKEFIESGEAELIIVVCDGTCLERNLNLFLQIAEIENNIILCVNLMDEAAKKHIKIDVELLSTLLGVAVVPASARNKKTLEKLKDAIDDHFEGRVKPNPVKAAFDNNADRKEKAGARVNLCREICRKAVIKEAGHNDKDRRLDRIFTGRKWGYPIMIAMLAFVFWFTMWGANMPSQLLSRGLFYVQDRLLELFDAVNAPRWLTGAAVLGVYRVLAWVVSVMLPPMAVFFPLFTLLEDSGYLPRVAYNLDRPFKKCRACGKQALTMCMGFGCNAVGVTGCRIIDSPRERLLAVITNCFVPCNGRLPAMTAVITMFLAGISGGFFDTVRAALILTLVVVFGIFMTFAVTALLSSTVLKGKTSSFTLEMPPYRRPQIGRVIVRSVFDRTLFVLGRAAAAAAPAGLVIWILANVTAGQETLLAHFSAFLDPVGRLMGLDGVLLMAFILGLPANEIVLPVAMMGYLAQGTICELGGLEALSAVLIQNGWTWVKAVCFILFSLMHWPCAATIMTIKKETGSLKWTAVSVIVPTLLGMGICMLFNLIFT